MSDLPDGWEWATLGELCEVNPKNFGTPPDDDDMVSLVRMAAVEEETGRMDPSISIQYGDFKKKSLTRFQEHDVLFAKVTPCMENGKIAVAKGLIGGRALGSSEFFVLRPPDGVEPRYLMLWLSQSAVRIEAERNMTGAVGLRRVPRSYLESLRLPVPPLAEQRRIVAALEDHLSRVEAGSRSVERARLRASKKRHSLLELAIRGDAMGKITPGKRSQETSDDPEAIPGGENIFPSRWPIVRLENLITAGRVPAYGVLQPGGDVSDGVPLIRVGDLVRGSVSDSNNKKISPEISSKFPRTVLQGGELLISLVGTIGRAALVEEGLAGANVARALAVFPIDSNKVDPLWVLSVVSSPSVSQLLDKSANEVARKTLNLGVARRCPIPLPPRGEQERLVEWIGNCIADLDRGESLVERVALRAQHLRRSVLREAFGGRLVKQDPADEPASVLLERIRAQRESAAQARKPRVKKAVSAKGNNAEGIAADRPLPQSVGKGTQDALDLGL